MMPSDTGRAGSSKVFVSYSLSDFDAAARLTSLIERYEVLQSAAWPSGLPASLALRDAIQESDIVVVLLPQPDDPARDSVFFEAGIAIGAGKPVVVVGDERLVPRDLASLTRVRAGDTEGLQEVIRTIAGQRRTPKRQHSPQALAEPALDTAQLNHAWSTMPPPKDGRALEKWVGEIFELAGARIEFSDIENHVAWPDISLWHDELQAPFGLPLPVEVLVSTRSLKPILDRLRRLMVVTGASSLLAVSAPGTELHERWADGKSLILAVDAQTLLARLGRDALPMALGGLLATATPSE